MISIAIPDSIFADERDSLRGKTVKAGMIARACSIFGVERIYIYRDMSGRHDRDYETARAILEYAETPPYLRRRLVPRRKDLEFAGLLTPLRTPNHMAEPLPKLNELREAVLVLQNNELKADVGARELARYEGKGQDGMRTTIRIENLSPLTAVQSRKPEDVYWGYEVRRAPSLARLLRSVHFELLILTSRLGEPLAAAWDVFRERLKAARQTIVCFGSPLAGVQEMLKQERMTVRDFPESMLLNMFPSQRTETVRLEEAILGSLALINLALAL